MVLLDMQNTVEGRVYHDIDRHRMGCMGNSWASNSMSTSVHNIYLEIDIRALGMPHCNS